MALPVYSLPRFYRSPQFLSKYMGYIYRVHRSNDLGFFLHIFHDSTPLYRVYALIVYSYPLPFVLT